MEQNTENNILIAAEQEFLDKGFSRTTTANIARLAGVNHAMLHYYFRSKENLFIKVFEKNIKEMSDLLSSLIQENLPFEEKIRNFIEAHFDFIAQNPKLPFFIVNEMLSDSNCVKMTYDYLQPVIDNMSTQLKKEIQKEVELGKIENISVENLIYNIISLNVCSFMALPIATNLLNISQEEYMQFIKQRKQENIITILNRLYKK